MHRYFTISFMMALICLPVVSSTIAILLYHWSGHWKLLAMLLVILWVNVSHILFCSLYEEPTSSQPDTFETILGYMLLQYTCHLEVFTTWLFCWKYFDAVTVLR
jgi:hypothetical protein